MIKMIRSDADYEGALETVGSLMVEDPASGTPAADELEVLSLLIENYERSVVPETLPTPLEAVRFRMEQQDLAPKDLVPFIGSRSKVSEVLSGKRQLTLSMIRALHEGLGIPAAVLIRDDSPQPLANDVEWQKFPTREMVKRGWLDCASFDASTAETCLRSFFEPLGTNLAIAALYRGTNRVRSGRTMNAYALTAWTARVLLQARANRPSESYLKGTVTPEFMREVAKLSWSDQGPRLAKEFLEQHGIALVIERHLPRTHLDGAAVLASVELPVIGLTLRFDRLDNFWFVLMHELAHLCLHQDSGVSEFYDDLEFDDSDPREKEADALAGEVLVPEEAWRASSASRLRTEEAARHLAKELGVHPAIVAGRMRHHFNSYRILNRLVGQGEVRRCFEEK